MGLMNMLQGMQESLKTKEYWNMNRAELLTLDNEELYEAIDVRVTRAADYMTVDECVEKLKVGVRVFYIVHYYEAEVNNGGLCQYFVNSSRKTAPFIIENLREIGANKHADLLTNFLEKYSISLDNLSEFESDDIDEYDELEERYPFDEFNDAFYDLYDHEHLSDVLVEYVRAHISEFAEE